MINLNKNIKAAKNIDEIIIDFKNGSISLNASQRLRIFRYAKFITQTYKYFQIINKNHISSELLEHFKVSQVRRTNLFKKNSFDENKKIYEEIKNSIRDKGTFSAKQGEMLYLLNSIYCIKFFNLISKIGTNNYEKSAFLYLAQRNYTDKILFNHEIFQTKNFIIKEFDALIVKQNGQQEITLVEAKTRLTKDGFRQIFGYNHKSLKTSHKDVLTNDSLCLLNGINNPITKIEIIFNQIDKNILKNYALGKYLNKYLKRFSLDISKYKFFDLCTEDIHTMRGDYLLINEDNLIELLCSQIEHITFTRLDQEEVDLSNYCLNHYVLDQFNYLFKIKK